MTTPNVWIFSAYTNPIIANNAFDASSNPLGFISHGEMTVGTGAKSPDESVGQDGPATATRRLRCRWQDRWTLARQILGGPITVGFPGSPTAAQLNSSAFSGHSALVWVSGGSGTSPGTVQTGDYVVFMPQQHPYFPFMYAKQISMTPEQGRGNDGGTASVLIGATGYAIPPAGTYNNWAEAILTVTYVVPQTPNLISAVDGAAGAIGYGAFIEESMVPSTEFMTVPNANLFWDNAHTNPIDATEAPGIQIKKVQWTVKRRKLPFNGLVFPLAVISQGFINNGVMYSTLGQKFASGCVLMDGLSMTPDALNDGSPGMQLEMHFTWQSVPYNTFPHVQGAPGTYGAVPFVPIYNYAGVQIKPFQVVGGTMAAMANLLAGW